MTTTTPTAGAPVTISGAGSTVGSGTTLQSYAWTLVDGGGIVSGFVTAENADTVSLTPSAAGNFTVRLTITDNAGASASTTRLVAVAAAPVVVDPPSSTPGTDTSGGGGAASLWWVLGVLAAALALLLDRWRRGRQAASGAG